VAGYFGSGMAADAFFVAFRNPNLLRRLFAEGSLTIAFIPVFTEYPEPEEPQDAFRLAQAVLTLLSLVLVTVTVFRNPALAMDREDPGLRMGRFRGESTTSRCCLTRITFPYILLGAWWPFSGASSIPSGISAHRQPRPFS